MQHVSEVSRIEDGGGGPFEGDAEFENRGISQLRNRSAKVVLERTIRLRGFFMPPRSKESESNRNQLASSQQRDQDGDFAHSFY